MEENGVARVFPFRGIEHPSGKMRIVRVDGRWNSDGEPHKFDLIEEWPIEENVIAKDTETGARIAVDPKGDVYDFRDILTGSPFLEPPEHAADDPAYAPLADVLREAHAQAATGKGSERHANGKPFDQQPIMDIARRHGVGFQLGQVEKKTDEAHGMLKRGEADAAIRELLGAINYTAAAILLIREHHGA
ncbi:hypothetical protein GOC60_14785 [Sinorhizobium meliloti]|nr:hypothetical protein [Sinorhizobium meliloti]